MNLKPLPSPNGTNKTGLYIPASWPWKEPTMAMDAALPRRTAPRQMSIAEASEYGRRVAEKLLAIKPRTNMAFDQVDDDAGISKLLDFLEQKLSTKDFERVLALVGDDDDMPAQASDARDIHPFARAKALGYLASKLSGDDFKQAHSLLTNNGDLPAPSKPTLPMTHRGSQFDHDRPDQMDYDKTRDGNLPKAIRNTYAGRDAARRKMGKINWKRLVLWRVPDSAPPCCRKARRPPWGELLRLAPHLNWAAPSAAGLKK